MFSISLVSIYSPLERPIICYVNPTLCVSLIEISYRSNLYEIYVSVPEMAPLQMLIRQSFAPAPALKGPEALDPN